MDVVLCNANSVMWIHDGLCWRVGDITRRFLVRGEWPARWEPQEEGMMSIAASFPLVKKPRFIVLREERQTAEGDADWLSNTPTRAPFNDTCWLVFGQ
jgi:hypothetical protein